MMLFALYGLSKLVVDEINDDHVIINNAFKTLYGVKISSNIEISKHSEVGTVEKLLALTSISSNKILYVVIRKEVVGGARFTSIYYFSYNKDLLKILEENFSSLNIKWLKGYEIANALYNAISLNPTLTVNWYTGEISHVSKHFSERDTGLITRSKFNKLMEEIDVEKYRVYVGTGILHDDVYFDKVLQTDFEGTIYITIDFNDQGLLVRKKKSQSLDKNLGVFKEMEDRLKSGASKYVGVSITFISKTADIDKAVEVLYNFGFSATEKVYGKDLYVLSPFNVRDWDYTFLFEPDQVGRFLIYTYEKSDYPGVAEVFGRNRHGSFVSFSFFLENNNPHCFIFAPTGAGKSFAMQNMITAILRITPKGLMKGEIENIRKEVRVRYFDKGFSAELLFKLMKERKYPVELFSARVDEILVNPVEVWEASTEELDFALSVSNMCLEALGVDPMTGYESIWFKRVLKELAVDKNKCSILSKSISILEQSPALEEVYEELRRRGYSSRTTIGEIKEKEFEYLKVPLVMDVERVLGSYSDDLSLTEEERKAIKRVMSKMQLLAEQELLKYPTKINLRDVPYVYIDYEFLSTSRFFTAILITLLKRLTYFDKFYKPENHYAYYVIDEAHNLLRNEYFNIALTILIREARKYRISMVFLTQNFEDLPPTMIQNADTIMFISPQEEEKRKAYLQAYFKHMGMDKALSESFMSKNLESVYFSTPPYTFTVQYSKGIFSLQLEVDRYKRMLFDSYARSVTTEDGITLYKSSFMGVEK